MTGLRVTRRGAFVAGMLAGMLATLALVALQDGYRECLARGYSAAVCSE